MSLSAVIISAVDVAQAEEGCPSQCAGCPLSRPGTPPKGAIILFDGKDTSKLGGMDGKPFPWKIVDGAIEIVPGTGELVTKEKHGSCRLYMEFRVPTPSEAHWEQRGNSGVYLQGRYEIQIIDSYGKDPESHQCGALYSIAAPSKNVCKKPGEWQSFDITFHAPKFDAQGKMTAKARLTLVHNGVKTLDNVAFDHVTPGPFDENLAQPGVVRIQNYNGAPVRFRNMWLLPLKDGD